MAEILSSLSSTPLPTILVVAGLVFLFLSIGGQLGAQLATPKIKRSVAGAIGGLLLVFGLGLYFVDKSPDTTEKEVAKKSELPADESEQVEEGHRLRAEKFQEGLIVHTQSNFHLYDGQLTLSLQGQHLQGSAEIMGTDTSQLEILSEEAGRPTVLKLTIVKEQVDTKVILGEEESVTSESGIFEGHSLLIQYKQGQWQKQLLGAEPTEQQRRELKTGYTDDFESYPDGMVALGESWQFEGAELAQLMGFGSYLSVDGSATMKFLEVVEYEGETCALITLQRLEMTAITLDGDGNEVTLNFGGEGRVYRSLDRFIDRQVDFNGNMKMQTEAVMEGQKVGIAINGPVTISVQSNT
ncbi:hypothetical protein ACFSJ3_10675 [Corallincola platygyrae]|uniref:LPS export ABC transporter periplasmic protein LptC n=1 Tax=Corallincola platygyrae TaxID=1193278 RepID=A0ABW4XNM4_9GAMM